MKHYLALFFSLASLTAYGSDFSDSEELEKFYRRQFSIKTAAALADFEHRYDCTGQQTDRQVRNAARHRRNDLRRTEAPKEDIGGAKSDLPRTLSETHSVTRGNDTRRAAAVVVSKRPFPKKK